MHPTLEDVKRGIYQLEALEQETLRKWNIQAQGHSVEQGSNQPGAIWVSTSKAYEYALSWGMAIEESTAGVRVFLELEYHVSLVDSEQSSQSLLTWEWCSKTGTYRASYFVLLVDESGESKLAEEFGLKPNSGFMKLPAERAWLLAAAIVKFYADLRDKSAVK